MNFDQIIPIIYLIGVLILVLPSFLHSNSKLKQLLANLSIYNHLLYTSRAPKIEDLFSDGPHLGSYSYEIGEPTLNAENTLGFENTLSFFNNRTILNLTTYFNYSWNNSIDCMVCF